jgi:membrane protein implicated in regulation of membrane protease activity
VDSPDTWQWIWLVTALVLAAGEMTAAGTFFLLPFAIGALVAAVLAFLDVSVAIEWLAFLVVSVGLLAAFRPLARKLDRDHPADGIGAKRLIGETATVLADIPAGDDLGLIRVHREEWRAESGDDTVIKAGTKVRVVEVKGTRAVVFPIPEIAEPPSETREQ